LEGFSTSRPQMIRVGPSGRSSSQLSLRRTGAVRPVLAASLGDLGSAQPASPAPDALSPGTAVSPVIAVAPVAPVVDDSAKEKDDSPASAPIDRSELAWRLRHARRGLLKDSTLPVDVMAADAPASRPGAFAPVGFAGQVLGSSARGASA